MISGIESGAPFLYSTELVQLDKQLLWRSTVYLYSLRPNLYLDHHLICMHVLINVYRSQQINARTPHAMASGTEYQFFKFFRSLFFVGDSDGAPTGIYFSDGKINFSDGFAPTGFD